MIEDGGMLGLDSLPSMPIFKGTLRKNKGSGEVSIPASIDVSPKNSARLYDVDTFTSMTTAPRLVYIPTSDVMQRLIVRASQVANVDDLGF